MAGASGLPATDAAGASVAAGLLRELANLQEVAMTGRISRSWLMLVTLLCTMLACTSAVNAEPIRRAGTATDELRWHLDQVLAMAQTPAFRAAGPERRREAVRRVTQGFFNWTEMSQRALGAGWRERSVPERREIAAWLGALGERAYMGQVEQLSARGVPRDPVRYLSEWTDGKHAFVRTVLMYPHEMPVDFLMARRGSRWEVHDVWVDGVSATQNYGAQFRRVMASGSFADLTDRMAQKARESDSRIAER